MGIIRYTVQNEVRPRRGRVRVESIAQAELHTRTKDECAEVSQSLYLGGSGGLERKGGDVCESFKAGVLAKEDTTDEVVERMPPG